MIEESVGWLEKMVGKAGGDTMVLAFILSRRRTLGKTLDMMMMDVQSRTGEIDVLDSEYAAVAPYFMS